MTIYNKDKELAELELDKKVFEHKNDVYQSSLAKQLTEGLGDEIKWTLNNPVKISKLQMLRLNIKKIIKDIFDVL